MAELQNERCLSDGGCDASLDEISQGTKRHLERTQSPEPPPKSPRTSPPPAVAALLEENPSGGGAADAAQTETMAEACADPERSPRLRRKSWRRSTRGRTSLPALPNPAQSLCKSISPELSDEQRLEKLMEAAMQVTVKRLRNTLRTVPGADLEAFQTQVDSLQAEWSSTTQAIREEGPLSLCSTSSDPAVQSAVERAKEHLNRLQAESLSWESMLNKHRSKAEDLTKRVEEGQERGGVGLDPSCVARSSQSQLIQNKPDYNAVLQRQQRVLNTMELVLESQCMMMRALLSFQEDSQLLVKETSARLARSAGFPDLPSSPAKTLLNIPQSSSSKTFSGYHDDGDTLI